MDGPGSWSAGSEVGQGAPSGTDRRREGLSADLGSRVRSIDHDRLFAVNPEVEPDIGHVADTGPEEHQVTGLQRRSRQHGRTRVVLALGGTWDLDSGGRRTYAAWAKPEQSNPGSPFPPQTYGLPICLHASAIAANAGLLKSSVPD